MTSLLRLGGTSPNVIYTGTAISVDNLTQRRISDEIVSQSGPTRPFEHPMHVRLVQVAIDQRYAMPVGHQRCGQTHSDPGLAFLRECTVTKNDPRVAMTMMTQQLQLDVTYGMSKNRVLRLHEWCPVSGAARPF